MRLWAAPRKRADLAALTAEIAELRARLAAAEQLADRDTLTPCLNRRGFMRELHRTLSVVERYKRPAAVIYIDLDGFKAINDRYGHAAGDAVLAHLGRVLVDHVRESDAVGRIGGDEFAVVLNDVGAEEAARKAEALARAIDEAALVHEGVAHRVRGSIGLHVLTRVEDPEIALARADEAMYAEKHARKIRAQAFGEF